MKNSSTHTTSSSRKAACSTVPIYTHCLSPIFFPLPHPVRYAQKIVECMLHKQTCKQETRCQPPLLIGISNICNDSSEPPSLSCMGVVVEGVIEQAPSMERRKRLLGRPFIVLWTYASQCCLLLTETRNRNNI